MNKGHLQILNHYFIFGILIVISPCEQLLLYVIFEMNELQLKIMNDSRTNNQCDIILFPFNQPMYDGDRKTEIIFGQHASDRKYNTFG